ncbi:MAG: DUF2760 domain-containing protein [Aureliella sp.]
MAKLVSAVFAGAAIYFVWGMLAWMLLPIHGPTVHELPAEQEIIDSMRAQNLESGVYIAPFAADAETMSDPESAFMKNHLAGPIFSIYLRKEGASPMGAGVLIGGLIIDLAAAAVAVCLLSCLGACGNSYWCRVGFVTGLGVFVAIVGHMSYWNWMYFPLDYTIAFVIDVIVGWTLAGLAIAALVKPGNVFPSSSQTHAIGQSQTTVAAAPQKADEPKLKSSSPKSSSPKPEPKPTRSDAISLLATLQREARFVDIVKEPLGDYSDEQVGAAARDVLRDCGSVLDRLFKIEPVLNQEDGTQVAIPEDTTAAKLRLTGNATEDAKSGTLVHHGWQAQQCELPKWTGSKEQALVIAQAEVEVQ